MPDTCATCKFHRKNPNDLLARSVVCKRYPPTVFPVQNAQGMAVMPLDAVVEATNWCGEFAAAQMVVANG